VQLLEGSLQEVWDLEIQMLYVGQRSAIDQDTRELLQEHRGEVLLDELAYLVALEAVAVADSKRVKAQVAL
jgi:hypothetical protein